MILQQRDSTYEMYVDLDADVFESLPDKSVLKCIMQPTYATQILDLAPAMSSQDINIDIATEEQVLVVNNADRGFSEHEPPSTSTAPNNISKKPVWPSSVIIRTEKFSHKLETALNTMKPGECLSWDTKREFVRHLTEKIFRFTTYPERQQIQMVAQAVVTKYPVLRDTIGSGIDSWMLSGRE